MAGNYLVSPWESCGPDLQEKIEEQSRQVIFEKGDVFCDAGDRFSALYVLQSGTAFLHRVDKSGKYTLAIPLYRGIWGAPAFLTGAHTATFRASSTCSVKVVPGKVLNDLWDDGRLQETVRTMAEVDFNFLLDVMGTLSQSDVESKLVSYMSKVMALATPPGQKRLNTMRWPFSISEMADWLSVSRPHLSSVVKSLRERRILEIGNGKAAFLEKNSAKK